MEVALDEKLRLGTQTLDADRAGSDETSIEFDGISSSWFTSVMSEIVRNTETGRSLKSPNRHEDCTCVFSVFIERGCMRIGIIGGALKKIGENKPNS